MFKFGVVIVALAFFLSGCAGKTKAPSAPPPAAKSAPAASQAQPAKKTEPDKKGTVCVSGTDSRTIEIVKADGCEVYYTKFADRRSVASSGHSMSHCEGVAERIQNNLEAGGFSCKN